MHTFTKEFTEDQGQKPISEYGIDVPSWIDNDLTVYDVDAIRYGGCESGAYMPAVTYSKANETMARYGDDVLDYISDHGVEMTLENESWSGFACKVLSTAVELWAVSIDDDLDPESASEAE